jgi:hypothetical protein
MHAAFHENYLPIARAALIGVTTVQNTGWLSLRDHVRVAVILHALNVTTTLDAIVEIATSAAGANAVTLRSMTQLAAADDNVVICFDVRPDALSSPADTSVNEFTHLNVKVTPNGAATVSVLVLGEPRSKPGTGWAQAV